MGSCKERGSVDLSAAADFDPGAAATASECVTGQPCGGIAVYAGGGWNPSVGTSAASPFVAAVLVRTGLAASSKGLMNTSSAPGPALLYTHGSSLTDVTSGSNDPSKTCSDVMSATPDRAWDGPTGWGVLAAYDLAKLAGATGAPCRRADARWWEERTPARATPDTYRTTPARRTPVGARTALGMGRRPAGNSPTLLARTDSSATPERRSVADDAGLSGSGGDAGSNGNAA